MLSYISCIYISDGLLCFLLCVARLLDGVLQLPLQLTDICIQLPLGVQQAGVLQSHDSKQTMNEK